MITNQMPKAEEVPEMNTKSLRRDMGTLLLLKEKWWNQLLQCIFELLVPHAVDDGI